VNIANQPEKAIFPVQHPLAARVKVPGSKSHTNRALLLAALAEGTTTLQNALFSDDSRYFTEALAGLGFQVYSDPDKDTLTVCGLGGHIPASTANLFIGNAGTAARFLTALLTLGHGEYNLDGSSRMRQRPISDLVTALNHLGAQVRATPNLPNDWDVLCPPVFIRANGLRGGRTSIRGDVSSQFLSAVLMVSPLAEDGVELIVEGVLNSRPYIDLTLGVMADFGVEVDRKTYESFRIFPQQYQSPGKYRIESDASAASYFFAAPAICGGWVEVADIGLEPRQGDIAFLEILQSMGCTILHTGDTVRVTGPQRLKGVDVDMADISDTALTLAAIAPMADTPTTIRGIASSRFKETDRVAAACNELRRIGVKVDEHPDGMTIYPCGTLQPATLHTYDDHRMAMAFALVGLRVPGIQIQNPACVDKTFPNFFEVLDLLK